MSTVVVRPVRLILASVLPAKLRGMLLLAVTAGAGYAFYVASAPEGTSVTAQADAVTIPPLVRAEPIGTPPPNIVRVGPETQVRPIETSAAPLDRPSLIRALQASLARAQCYDGKVTGVWNDASKNAMAAFNANVNAQLPVDEPDPAMLALLDSNAQAKCTVSRAIYTGTLGAGSAAAAEAPSRQQQASITPPSAAVQSVTPAPPPPVNAPSMIERPWAAPEMLVPPKESEQAPAAPTPAPVTVGAIETPPAQPVTPAASPPNAPGKPVVAPVVVRFQSVSVEPDPGLQAAPPQPQQKVAQRKKTRRRPADDGFSFQSIQKSISSMFD